ncbi:hypothetical protein ACFW9F_16980 [Streptomyces sp. NPDC059506]|uniref:hypothetical protein n=1 Tax=Streptomyces sp. NPDC059506 TaxID=3347751 RepID=UPI00368F2C7A
METLLFPDSIPVESNMQGWPDQSPYSVAVKDVLHQDGADVTAWVVHPVREQDGTEYPPRSECIYRTRAEDAADETQVLAAVLRAKLALIAHDARQHLRRLGWEEQRLDEGFGGTSYTIYKPGMYGGPRDGVWEPGFYTPQDLESARGMRFRAFQEAYENARYGQQKLAEDPHAPYDRAWVEKTLALGETVRTQRARIREIQQTDRPETEFAIAAHLIRSGASRADVARLMFWDTDKVRDLLDSVTVARAARLVGVKPGTWRSYVTREQAPQPRTRIGSDPVWALETLLRWQENRPGPGRPKKAKTTAAPRYGRW